jgi:LuxR family maltose regulon positive regulatory protein
MIRWVSTPVLATKLFAPARRTRSVARPRVAVRLDATLEPGHRLTLVSAPAGFGKTTAVGDWLADLGARPDRPHVAWLSLDPGDDDPARLLTHLVAALDGAGLDVDPAVLDAVGAGSPAAALTALVNDLTVSGELAPDDHWVLVLDDYHALGAREAHEAVAFLLEHGPPRLHLVIATRSDPPLPLARLRSRGQLTEVRATDLRFTPSEAQDFLARVMGLDLTTEGVDALEDRTEGWIAGLQLAGLSLQGIDEPGDVTGFIDAFTGSHRFVIDYLADEVLARQPADVREFLLCTAVLDRLTGSSCDAVTGRADGARVLADLERANLFLVPLDAHRSWYRYHHLFADVLRARLLADEPDRVPDLHRRASAWYAARGLVEDAVRHALAAGDVDRAAVLAEEALPALRRARQDAVLTGWARSLPDAVLRRRPVLGIMSGWSLMLAGDLDAAEARLDDADAALAAAEQDPGLAAGWADTEDLRTAPATIWLYRAALAQARGDVEGTRSHARRALERAAPDDHFVRGGGAGFLGLATWAAGDVGEALETFADAVRSLHAAGNLVDELDSTVVLADMWIAAGRPGRARELYRRALEVATGGGEPYPRATADLHVGLAQLDLELDDLPAAEAHLETARVLGARASITENRHRWFVVMAGVRAARGDTDTALDLLDEAQLRYRPGSYPDVRPRHAAAARVRIAAGDLAAVSAWARDHGLGVDDDPAYLREYEHLTLARLLLARHRDAGPAGRGVTPATPGALSAVLGLLDRMHASAERAGRAGSLLEIRVLLALAHHARGDRPRAVATWVGAVAGTPEPDSHVRLHLDEGPAMQALLGDVVDPRRVPGHEGGHHEHGEHEDDAAARERARRLLERSRTPSAPPPTAARQALVEPLSQRELDVLRLLDTELAGPQIARELYVSINTLRTHTRRIFTKLDVTSRMSAVRRAHELGLI